MKTIVKSTGLSIALLVALSTVQGSPYQPRGWRPSGRNFDPANQNSYGPPNPPSNSYGPQGGTAAQITTTSAPFIEPITTTSTTTTSTTTTATTEKSREPTTPFPDYEFANSPALAVANSFAFNRPIYVYNSYPYYSGYTVLK